MRWKDIEHDKRFKRTREDQQGNTITETFFVDVWTIPQEQTKADRQHIVPLPPLASEIIRGLSNDGPYVFESPQYEGRPVKWLNEAFKRVSSQASVPDVWIHDLRRTCATFMAELGVDRTILGKVLNHKGLSGDSQVTARYDRHSYIEEKRQALNRWNSYLNNILEGQAEAKIIKIGLE